MLTLADTDIILKLTACDLLDETLDMFGVTVKEVFVYQTELRRVCMHNAEVIEEYSRDVLNMVITFANLACPIKTAIDPEEQVYMNAAESSHGQIDGGEQVIFGATRGMKDFRVLTSDKKALRVLAFADGCGGIYNRMQHRVYCLEQIILLLIGHIGFEEVLDRVLPALKHDKSLSEVFAAGRKANQAEVEKALQERIELLRQQTRGLLAL